MIPTKDQPGRLIARVAKGILSDRESIAEGSMKSGDVHPPSLPVVRDDRMRLTVTKDLDLSCLMEMVDLAFVA